MNFRGCIFSIAWSGADNFVTGCQDGTVLKWVLLKTDELTFGRVVWGVSTGVLNTIGASIQDVQGLSFVNGYLMKQRGALEQVV
jgi:hypothetical protein